MKNAERKKIGDGPGIRCCCLLHKPKPGTSKSGSWSILKSSQLSPPLCVATTTAMLSIAEMVEIILPIFIIRVLSPAVVFLAALSFVALRPVQQPAPTPITSVVVATNIPRRAAILAFLSFIALTYLGDGLVFVVFAVISKQWPRHSGIPINTLVGLASFSGLAVIGAWKDVAGVHVWSLKRLKTAVSATLALDIALAVLLGLQFRDIGMSINRLHHRELSLLHF